MRNFLFTSESVCNGHPDKICDGVSDAILDAVLSQDPNGRVAVETLVTDNKIILAGEVTTKAKVDFEQVAREHIKKLGYIDKNYHFSHLSSLENFIHQQSPEIATGVDSEGAGDQGMMFGYACRQTPELMPLPITLAHKITKRIDQVREEKIMPYLRPDGKSQVTIEYINGKPKNITHVVVAVPHSEEVDLVQVKKDIYHYVVSAILDQYGFTISQEQLIVNGTGVWHQGGPFADTGVTGRKIVVDTYGGYARVGGGAFSGKDPTKVDRSGAYAARFLAKNIVAQKMADDVEVCLAYCIGIKKPLMQQINTFGTERVSLNKINKFVEKLLDTSVGGILKEFSLQRPIYTATSAYGHFGREDFPWEKTIEI